MPSDYTTSPPLRASSDMAGEHGIWRCSNCGEPPDGSPKWRWAGDHWQHYHGYPIGHEPAWYFPAKEADHA